MSILIICNNRAERGPMESVIAALPEARVVGLSATDQEWDAHEVMRCGLEQFTREYHRSRPRLVIVVGDRYETLAAVQAAYLLRIPVAHIHGGERTAGAMDDAFRHSVTRMSTLHFCATQDAADVVFGMFAATHDRAMERKIYVVGAPGLDGIEPLGQALWGGIGRPTPPYTSAVLVTYHPETRHPHWGLPGCMNMLLALRTRFDPKHIHFCGVNNDPGRSEVYELQRAFAAENGCPWPVWEHAEYVRNMRLAALVVGNSSAGVIEAPWVGIPSVNIGDRQLGRPMAPSVFQNDADIGAAIDAAMSTGFRYEPCYKGGAAPRIAEVVRGWLREHQ